VSRKVSTTTTTTTTTLMLCNGYLIAAVIYLHRSSTKLVQVEDVVKKQLKFYLPKHIFNLTKKTHYILGKVLH
jgi:hypothetical protein